MQYGSGTTKNYMNYDHVIEISIDEAEQNPIFSIEYSGPTFNNLFAIEKSPS